MALSDARRKATIKYLKKNKLVGIVFRVTESKRAEYKSRSVNLGYLSFNKFVIEAIEEKLERDSR